MDHSRNYQPVGGLNEDRNRLVNILPRFRSWDDGFKYSHIHTRKDRIMTQVNSGIWRTMERQQGKIDKIYTPPKDSKRTTGNVWHSNGSVMDNYKATKAQRSAAFHGARDLMNSFRL